MPLNLSGIQIKENFAKIIFGDPATHALENRLFNVILITAAFTGVCGTTLNFYSGNPVREIIITLVATAVPVCFYIASRWYNADKYLRVPLTVIFLIILCVAWITNQGSNGSTILYFFILFVAGKICLASPYDKLILGISFIAVITLLVIEYYTTDLIMPYLSASNMFLDKVMSMVICLVTITMLLHLILKEYQNEKAHSEELYKQTLKDKETLIQALTENKILKGVLPVCSFCKKIRNENNEWQTMESYITSRSDAKFSHSFCPDCGKRHYPEYYERLKK